MTSYLTLTETMQESHYASILYHFQVIANYL